MPRKKPGKTSYHPSKSEKEGACCYPREKGEGPVSNEYVKSKTNQQLDVIYDKIVNAKKTNLTKAQITALAFKAHGLTASSRKIHPTDPQDKSTLSFMNAKVKSISVAAEEAMKEAEI